MLSSAASPAAASVPTNQSYPVPASGTYTMHGHGFGHGHGMSQYGAYGAAKRGLTYRQIVGFYYPGTTWGRVRSRIRVLLTSDTTTDLVVSRATGLAVHDLGSRATYRLPRIAGAARWRLDVSGTRTVVDYLTSAWHRYRPGGRATLVGDGQFGADEPITLWTPSGSRSYRGGLRAASPAPGSTARDTVNVVSLDAYVQGVIPAEMPASWSTEAVKAQAVAARTYATWSRTANPGRYWHICDTSACQVYHGAGAEDPRSNAAVAATARQILTYQHTAAFTQFASSSGGWTSAGSRPYLVAEADPYDGFAGNPVHTWSAGPRAPDPAALAWGGGGGAARHQARRPRRGGGGGSVLRRHPPPPEVSGCRLPFRVLVGRPSRLFRGFRPMPGGHRGGRGPGRGRRPRPGGCRRGRGVRRCRRPGAVIEASIFIASMVATVAPASTDSPSETTMLTTPSNGAAT